MEKLSKLLFPLYRVRHYLTIEENALKQVKITTIKKTYILDDKSYPHRDFAARRVAMVRDYPEKDIYKLGERVDFLRHLVKYPSGTTFVNKLGEIVCYKKGNKFYLITSKQIISRRFTELGWTIFTIDDLDVEFLVTHPVTSEVRYASIMQTNFGPFLYDLTYEKHEPYKRKI